MSLHSPFIGDTLDNLFSKKVKFENKSLKCHAIFHPTDAADIRVIASRCLLSKWPGLLECGTAAWYGQHRQPRGHVRQDPHGGPDKLRPALQWDHLQQRRHRPIQLHLCQAPDRLRGLQLQHHVWPGTEYFHLNLAARNINLIFCVCTPGIFLDRYKTSG